MNARLRMDDPVVTIRSRVSFRDEPTGTTHVVTVVYPHESSPGERRISMLSPIGRALLGRRVGDVLDVEIPDRGARRIRILALHDDAR